MAAAPVKAEAPLWLFEGAGLQARQLAGITWGLLVLSVAVVALIATLVLVAAARRREDVVLGDRGALRWIGGGIAVTTLVLLGFVVWTVRTLAAVETPGAEPTRSVEVTGHQFWWELRYPDSPGGPIVSANEIHIPTGEPVRFRLMSEDVIHSFWVPALGGKTDLIPGQVNETWLEADEPGTYAGQCAEYCGLQHARMAFRVIAEPPAEFEAWRKAQARPAAPATGLAAEGQRIFVDRCGECHTVRGVNRSEEPGPDLTHLMSRETLAAGMLPNTPGHLAGWITNPEALKPGTTMPTVELSAAELQAVRAWLATLE